MQYSVATWTWQTQEEWQQDLIYQELGDLGFEAFDNNQAYIQSALLDETSLRVWAQDKKEIAQLRCKVCPDENWNRTWEEEHGMAEIVLPTGTMQIIPHCAFGAGYHETTSMLTDALIERYKQNKMPKSVLDNGCGTGILGIAAAMLGAEEVTAVDIDDKAVQNTCENAQLNGIQLHATLGNQPPQGTYDLILSNIHRNILIEQMPLYSRYLKDGGELWLSGFMEADCAALLQAAAANSLKLINQTKRNEWILLQLSLQPKA